MSYIAIESFRLGLDARKSELTSQAGTLQTLENAYVNTGGEIAKRKAFVDDGTLAGTFGLEVVDLGIVTFWSGATGASVPDVAATPIKLVHPVVANGYAPYDAGVHELVAVPFSTNYNGKPFVAGKFSDGNTFFYYDYTEDSGAYTATLITESYTGLVLAKTVGANIGSVELAQQLASQMELTLQGYGATYVNAPPPEVLVTSPYNQQFSLDISAEGGVIADTLLASGFAGTGSPASASFVTSGASPTTGNWTITADSSDGVGTVALLTAVDFGTTDASVLAAGIVAAINAQTAVHGFTAQQGGTAGVFVYFPVAWGSTPTADHYQIHVTSPYTLSATTPTLNLSCAMYVAGTNVAANYTYTIVKHGATGFASIATITTGQVSIVAAGGSPFDGGTYKYTWLQLSGDTTVEISSEVASTVTFSAKVLVYYDKISTWKCTVEDKTGLTVDSVELTVRLQYRV